jgi:hypothetical protein
MSKIILFNAPPGSGKDIAVEYLSDKYGVFPCSFKTHLFHITQAIYNIDYDTWNHWYTREGKELPREELNGLSPRQALIHVSENVIKPNFGKDFFGKHEATWLKKHLFDGQIAAFSDCGFDEEVIPLIEAFGKENVFICFLSRPNCSFEGDSRNYVSNKLLDLYNYWSIINAGTLKELYSNIDTLHEYVETS